MSADLFKAEAKRLAAHLADNHGIKLKHTSILEAVAALHGVRDWNTLLGTEQPSLVQRVLRTKPKLSEIVDFDELLYRPAADGLRLGLTQDKSRAVELSNGKLRQHLLIVGRAGSGSRTMLEHLMVQQVMRGGGLLVIDPYGDAHTAELLEGATQAAGREDFEKLAHNADPHAAAFDCMSGPTAEHVANRLLGLLPSRTPPNPGIEFYVQQVHFFLCSVIEAHRLAQLPLTALDLYELLREPQNLVERWHQQSSGSESWLAFSKTMTPFLVQTKEGPKVDAKTFLGTFGAFVGRLAQYVGTAVGRQRQPGTKQVVLAHSIAEARVTYAGLDFLTQEGPGQAMAQFLRHDFFAALSEPSRERANGCPYMVVLPHVDSLQDKRWSSFAAQARAYGVTLVFHANSLADLRDEDSLARLLGNTFSKVFYRPATASALQIATECLESQLGPVRAAEEGVVERLTGLGIGEALYLDGNSIQGLRTCMAVPDR